MVQLLKNVPERVVVNVDTFISLQLDELVSSQLVGAIDRSFDLLRLVFFSELRLVEFCGPGRAIDTAIFLNLSHALSWIALIL